MGGAAVSSADTGAFGIELRCDSTFNQKCKKRANAIRGLVESDINPIVFTITELVDI
jgi:phosphoribosylformylglycinamidine synthase